MSILSDTKTLLEITDTSFDTVLNDIIAAILARADECMDIRYSPITNYTQYWDGDVYTVYMDYANVSDCLFYEDDTLLTEGREDDYILYAERGVIKAAGEAFAPGQKILRAEYSGGYAEDNLPTGFRRAMIKQASFEFRRRKDPGLQSITYPDGSINKYTIDEWLKDVKSELQRCSRIFI